MLLDDGVETYTDYGISKYPTIILVGADGRVVPGGDLPRFEAALEALRAGKDGR